MGLKNSSTILRDFCWYLSVLIQLLLLPLNYYVACLERVQWQYFDNERLSGITLASMCTIPVHVICSSLKYFLVSLFAQLNVPLTWSKGKNHDKRALNKHVQDKNFYLSLKSFCFLFSFVLKRIGLVLIQGSVMSELLETCIFSVPSFTWVLHHMLSVNWIISLF